MLVLKTCTGETCANPYGKLLPSSLAHKAPGFADLLHQDLDGYFTELPKVSFKACGLGYHRALEQPEWDDKWVPQVQKQGRENAGIVFQGGDNGRMEGIW
jgi:hypothetical protein